MSIPDYILLVLTAAAGLAAAIGGVILTLSSPNYRAARGAFAIAALCFGVLGIVWGVSVEKQPMLIRLGAAGAIAGGAAVALTWLLLQLKEEQPTRAVDAIYQAGVIVGKVFGARRSPQDATLFTFVEVSDASQLNVSEEFEFQNWILRYQSFRNHFGSDSTRPKSGTLYDDFVAKIIGEISDGKRKSIGPFQELSDAELRQKVAELARTMRALDAKWSKKISGPPPFRQTNEEALALQKKMVEDQRDKALEYRNDLHTDALAMLREMRFRLRERMPDLPPTLRALVDAGMLAGVDPISNFADYLQGAANLLPAQPQAAK